MEKKYYKLLDIIRVFSCIGVFLYHLGYLQGGFLVVCTFFVLSGYLSYISISKGDKVSLFDYYKNRIIHIYIPLLIVVFFTISLVSCISTINWFQLKPETTSVLLGYNNYWQLSVNADYFARHISSPFMHFWYIGILLQFEIIFPFVFYIIRFLKNKINKVLPVIILLVLIILSSYYYINCKDIMRSYYDTLARSYSLLLGVLIGYIHKEYSSLTFKKCPNLFFYGYLLILIILQLVVNINNSFYAIIMILVSLISCRLIDYATLDDNNTFNLFDKAIKYFSSISYEIYLFQYPVIFFFQYLNLPIEFKVPLIVFVTVIISLFLHFCLDFKKKKYIIIKYILNIFIVIVCLFGAYKYVLAKDYTNEMNDLKKQLSNNEKLITEKQKDYENRLKEENDNWNSVLNDLENGEKEISNYVTNLPIVAVGDSVMLGAIPILYQTFPNGHFDAAVSRTDYEANKILLNFKNQNLLSNDVLIHLGTNGQCGIRCQKEIMNTIGDRKVFLVTVSNDNDVHVNHTLYELEKMYSNISIIDWYGASSGHREYFVADGVHLTGTGVRAYSQTIYDGVYNYYHQQFEEKRNRIIKEHEDEVNSKIDFYGNQVLLNVYPLLQEKYNDSKFVIQEELSVDDLIIKLNNEIQNNALSKNVVISIDKINDISFDDYNRIIELLNNYNVYFLYIYHKPNSFSHENVYELNFYNELKKHSDYLMVDGIHLSSKGNQKLLEFIYNKINKKD